MLIKDSPVPLYYQLAEHLREQIQSGALQPGEKLPSERELSQTAGVSRMTARQALAYLVKSGLLTVHHGVGAFVAEPKVAYSILHLRSFTESMAQEGSTIFSEVLVQAVGAPPVNVAASLGLAEDALTVKLVRLRGIDGLPLLLETSYVAHALCPALEEMDLANRSLYMIIEEEYGLRVSRATQVFESITASDYEKQIFQLEEEVPMLLLKGVTYTTEDIPLEYFEAAYRGDRCSFVFESQRDGESPDTPIAQLSVRIR